MNERAVRLASKLYECRDAARALLGERYHQRMTELGAVLQRLASSRKCDVLTAALEAAKCTNNGMDQMQVLAAAVELTEPSA